MRAGLSALLSPVSSETFFARHWPGQLAVVHGAEAARSELFEIPELQSLDVLLRGWNQPVSVVLPSHRDEYSKVVVDPPSARKLYENGMSLTFALVERQIPALETWLTALRLDLGLPASTRARC